MRRWKAISLVVLLVSSGRLPAEELPRSLESLETQIRELNQEREELQSRLLELDRQLAELAALRDQAAFEEGAKGGVYILTSMLSTLRASPDALNGRVLAEIAEGTKLRALEFKYPFWKVEYRGIYGYLSDIFVVKDEQAKAYLESRRIASEAGASRGLIGPVGVAGPQTHTPNASPAGGASEAYSGSNSTPARTAVQCSGYTKKGTRCKRMTTNPNGRCWQHE